MMKSAIIFSMLLSLNLATKPNETPDLGGPNNVCENSLMEEKKLNALLFLNDDFLESEDLDWSKINLVEIEELVDLGFETAHYLPDGFNALKGKHDLNWSAIELIEIEEEVVFDFDINKHLPKNFNPLKGMHDLDWSTIKLIEIEEEVTLNFNTQSYLPKGFNAYAGMHKSNTSQLAIK